MSEQDVGQEAPGVDTEAPATAPTEAAQVTDTQAETTEETAVAKTFTQAELDDIVKSRIAKAEAKAERRVLRALERLTPQQAAQQQYQAPVDAKPSRQNGESDDAYLDRLTDWKLDQRDRASSQQKQQEQHQSLSKKTESLYAEAEKIAGFDRDDFNALPLTQTIAQALTESDVAPRLMAYMTSNPEDVARIANLSPVKQAAELGKLEARLSVSTPSKAAPPINPIGSRGGASNSLESANLDEYAAMRAKQGAPWARQ